MRDRFSEAKKYKNRGAVIALAICIAFLVFVLITRSTMAIFTMGLLLAVFIVLILWTILRFNSSLEDLKSAYPNLEWQVNSCQDQVAGKYFFLEDALVDLASAKIYYYAEMDSVRCARVRNRQGRHTSYGYMVQIKYISGETFLVADFQNGYVDVESEKQENFRAFTELFSAHAPGVPMDMSNIS